MPLILRIHTYRKQTPATPTEKSFDPLGGTIGRGLANDLVLEDNSKFISRTHCRVDFRDGGYFLTDLGSNPSLINQRPVGNGKQMRLGHGDLLDIGEYQLQVIVTEGNSTAPPPMPMQLGATQYDRQAAAGLETAPGLSDPLADASILHVGAGLGGHTSGHPDPLGLGVHTGPLSDPLNDPLFGKPKGNQSNYAGSVSDHLAAQHMPMPVINPILPDDFLLSSAPPAPAPAFAPAPAAVRPVQNFIPDDFDLLAPAPAAYAPPPAPMPAAPPMAYAAPAPAPASALPAGFDPLAPAPLPGTPITQMQPVLGANFDPLGAPTSDLGADFDPLGAPVSAPAPAAIAATTAHFADPLGAPVMPPAHAGQALGANFDPLGEAPTMIARPPVAPVAPVAQAPTKLSADFDPLSGFAAPTSGSAQTLGADFDPLGGAPLAPAPMPAPVPAPAPVFAPVPAPAPAPVFAPIPAPVVVPPMPPVYVPAPVQAPMPAAVHAPVPPVPVAAHAGAGDAEIMAALLRGLGLPELKGKLSNVEMAELVGSMLREAVDGTMGVLMARSMTKREIRIEATMIAPKGNNPMKFFPDSEAALTQMLTNAWAGYMPGVKAVSNAFDDLRAHELATIAGMRAALGGVLARFDPAAIEARLAEPTVMDKMMASKRKAKMWDRMVELYGQMSNEAEDDFQRLFGENFAQAYEEQTEKMRQMKR